MTDTKQSLWENRVIWPPHDKVGSCTDKYFTKSRAVAEKLGDVEVTYAVFLRRPALYACGSALHTLRFQASERGAEVKIEEFFSEGDYVAPETPLFTYTGSYSLMSELETIMLQRVGLPCISAFNAYRQCKAMGYAGFLDMHARHGFNPEMNMLAAYGAAVGSRKAQQEGCKGFIGSSIDLTAPFYTGDFESKGMGTMPHALIGYSGGHSFFAAQKYLEAHPDETNLTVLIDYFGQEYSHALYIAEWFYHGRQGDESPTPASQGKTLAFRMDTHGGRFAEGLDYKKSVAILERELNISGEYEIVRHVMGTAFDLDQTDAVKDKVRKMLFGTGMSAAAVFEMRHVLDYDDFHAARIVVSSGFDVRKCTVFGKINVPADVVGTGSFLPDTMSETYATADIINYGDRRSIKVGREWLVEKVDEMRKARAS